MKKLLSILATTSLITSSSTLVVACGDKTDSLGMIITNGKNIYFQDMKDHAISYAKTKGYSINAYDSEQDSGKENSHVQSSILKDKAILMNPVVTENSSAIKDALDEKIPVVAFDTEYKDHSGANAYITDTIESENILFKAVYKQVTGVEVSEAKKQWDPKKIKVIAIRGVSGNDADNKRWEGFFEKNKGLYEIIGGDKNYTEFNTEDVAKILDPILTNKENLKADVIYGANDPLALGIKGSVENITKGEWFTTGGQESKGGYIVGFDGLAAVNEDIAKWKTTDREHIFMTMAQDPNKTIELTIDEAIKLIDEKNDGKEVPIKYDETVLVPTKHIKPEGIK